MALDSRYVKRPFVSGVLKTEEKLKEERRDMIVTLQDLHFQTKFASPLLPDISLFS